MNWSQIFFVYMALFFCSAISFTTGYQTGQDSILDETLITECEANLPRTQHCRFDLTAIVVAFRD